MYFSSFLPVQADVEEKEQILGYRAHLALRRSRVDPLAFRWSDESEALEAPKWNDYGNFLTARKCD